MGLLLLVQSVYNIFVAENTKILPVYIIYRYNLDTYRLAIISGINNQAANLQVRNLKAFYKELAANLVFFIKKYIVLYYNKYRNMESIFKERDKIYLIQRNIQTKQPNIKLDYKKLGLFKIRRIIRLVNYKLVLPKIINIHLVFYTFLLELVLPGAPLVLITEIKPVNPNTKYKIEEILDYKQIKGQVKYLVK
jgi:hypothetical protein